MRQRKLSLGVMYENGAGVDQSVTEAVRWYRLAAEQGHARGQKYLGTMYEFGAEFSVVLLRL